MNKTNIEVTVSLSQRTITEAATLYWQSRFWKWQVVLLAVLLCGCGGDIWDDWHKGIKLKNDLIGLVVMLGLFFTIMKYRRLRFARYMKGLFHGQGSANVKYLFTEDAVVESLLLGQEVVQWGQITT